MTNKLVLVRHGETEWSRSRRHTGTTDLPLLPEGEEAAGRLAAVLSSLDLALVLSSPRQRAIRTAELALPGVTPEITEDLCEWNYGEYEGITTATIRETRPDWDLWTQGCPGGESPDQVGERAERLIKQAESVDGTVAMFAHGHILRVIGGCWIGLGPAGGQLLGLDTATISVLDFERETRVVRKWNTLAL